ncbi:hypothetical protein D3C84_674180 [compost metagenome]
MLQLTQNARQSLVDGRLEHFQATSQTALKVEIALDAARNVALHVVHQIDRLLLPGAGLFQLVANDVVAEKPGGGFRREAIEVFDHPVQVTIEFGVQTFAVGVPQRVMHRIGRDVVTNHQRNGLFEQGRGLAGIFRIQRKGSRTRL